jgi:hypothetical protein
VVGLVPFSALLLSVVVRGARVRAIFHSSYRGFGSRCPSSCHFPLFLPRFCFEVPELVPFSTLLTAILLRGARARTIFHSSSICFGTRYPSSYHFPLFLPRFWFEVPELVPFSTLLTAVLVRGARARTIFHSSYRDFGSRYPSSYHFPLFLPRFCFEIPELVPFSTLLTAILVRGTRAVNTQQM